MRAPRKPWPYPAARLALGRCLGFKGAVRVRFASQLLVGASFLAPAAALAQPGPLSPPPPAEPSFEELLLEDLPPIPDAPEPADDPLPPPPEEPLPPPEPVFDAEIASPLAPLAEFDTEPRTDIVVAEARDQGVRYTLAIEGLDEVGLERDFRRLSTLHRGRNRAATPAQIASRARTDTQIMDRLLASEGYFDAQTDSRLSFDGEADVRLVATPGDRYSWREITLDLIPDDRPDLAEGFALKVGQPVRAIEVEEAEAELLTRLLEAGYPFAEIGVRDVVLDTDQPTATYLLTGDTGLRGVFGPIRMAGHRPFSDEHARLIARFADGDPYDARLLDDFRRALIATQQFAGLSVAAVDTGLRDAEGRAVTEIRVTGAPAPSRLLRGQAGVSTDEGVRGEVAWRHRNLIQPEGQLTLRGVVGTREQRAATEFQFSNFGQRDRTLAAIVEVANLTPPAFLSTSANIAASLTRASTAIWQKEWTWSLGFVLGAASERERARPQQIVDDTGEAVDRRRRFLFAALPGWVGLDRSDDLLDPTRGFRLRVDLAPEVAREITPGNVNVQTYLRAFLEGSAYVPTGPVVLAARARVGTLVGAERDLIAPSRRLYVGGGGSVRGYDFQGVGPRGPNDLPIGGRGSLETSLEARYRFGDFGIVGFVDAGTLNDDWAPTLDGLRVGAGVGARYYSSFGPLRIDVARAITRSSRDPRIAVYISIGQSF